MYTPQVGRAIVRGLLRTTLRKDPDRLRRLITALDQRIRGEGVRVPEEGVETLRWLHREFGEEAEPSQEQDNKSDSDAAAVAVVDVPTGCRDLRTEGTSGSSSRASFSCTRGTVDGPSCLGEEDPCKQPPQGQSSKGILLSTVAAAAAHRDHRLVCRYRRRAISSELKLW